jgi:ABC-type transporter Mla subunit MlaD
MGQAYSLRPRYVPFPRLAEDAEIDGAEAVRQHLRWLLANMDWFAAQGRGPLASASVSLHRDLAQLGYAAPSGKTAEQLAQLLKQPTAQEIAALVQPPNAQQVAREVAQLHEKLGSARGHLHSALQELHTFYHLAKELYYHPETTRVYQQMQESIKRALAGMEG